MEPSWPRELSPKANRLPSVLSAREWSSPQATCSAGNGLWRWAHSRLPLEAEVPVVLQPVARRNADLLDLDAFQCSDSLWLPDQPVHDSFIITVLQVDSAVPLFSPAAWLLSAWSGLGST